MVLPPLHALASGVDETVVDKAKKLKAKKLKAMKSKQKWSLHSARCWFITWAANFHPGTHSR